MTVPAVLHVDGCPVRVRRSRLLPAGVDAMTLPRVILLRHDHTPSAELLVHESAHVRQWRRYGRLGFLRRYLGDYLRGRRGGLDHRDAYLAIAFEEEARLEALRFRGQGSTLA